MPDLWARDVDRPRGRPQRLAVSDSDYAAVAALPAGGLRPDPDDPDLLTCGPLPGDSVLVTAAGRVWRVRRASCGLPSCGCALEAWPAGRRKPIPEPGWLHVETWDDDDQIVGCRCGALGDGGAS